MHHLTLAPASQSRSLFFPLVVVFLEFSQGCAPVFASAPAWETPRCSAGMAGAPGAGAADAADAAGAAGAGGAAGAAGAAAAAAGAGVDAADAGNSTSWANSTKEFHLAMVNTRSSTIVEGSLLKLKQCRKLNCPASFPDHHLVLWLRAFELHELHLSAHFPSPVEFLPLPLPQVPRCSRFH